MPYTAFSAKKSYIEENPEIIQSFTNALQKGMNYVQSHSAEEIAKVIQPQFEETDLEPITTIERYYREISDCERNFSGRAGGQSGVFTDFFFHLYARIRCLYEKAAD